MSPQRDNPVDATESDSSALQRQIVSMQDEIDRLRRIEVEYATVKKMFTFTAKDLEG